MQSTVTVKGQVTLPKPIREHLGVSAGDRIRFFPHPDGGVTILPVLPISSLRGILKGRREGVLSVDEMDRAIADTVDGEYVEMSRS